VAFASTLIPVSLFPVLLGMTGQIYLVGALILGGCFVYFGIRVAIERTNIRARQVLIVSVAYLPLIMALLVIDRQGF
jgi:protoheme IX farnesyltransferase